jgi:hypothetical protein
MITENYIWELLQGKHDYHGVIRRIENLNRQKAPGLEKHHIEPERVRVVYLKPLEHLAIHIAHAKVENTSSHYAKVGSFVRLFPGSYRRILTVDHSLRQELISFGQKRPGNEVILNQHPNTIAARGNRSEKQRAASAETGRRTILLNSWHVQGITNTWGDKVAEAARNKPMCCCLLCGKEMKAITSNITQHQRSNKCSSSMKKQNA